jgi:hypothetical protein
MYPALLSHNSALATVLGARPFHAREPLRALIASQKPSHAEQFALIRGIYVTLFPGKASMEVTAG